MHEHKQPTRADIRQEKVLFWVLNVDGIDMVLVTAIALATGSLTLIADALRTCLSLTVGYFSLWILYRKHRNRLEWFEFGSGKLERMVWCTFGLAMLIGAIVIFGQVVSSLFNEMARPSPMDRSIAAITRSSNLLINVLGWLSILFILRKKHSDVFVAQFYARSTMMGCSIFLQITLTLAALSQTAIAGFLWDVIGAMFVVGIMFYSGVRMIARGLPDLMDAPVREADLKPVKSLLRNTFSSNEIRAIRARRSADTIFLEVTLCQEAVELTRTFPRRVDELQSQLEQLNGRFDITLVGQTVR
ncbi:MAG: cation transporter [Rhizobiaceae bacterium]